MAVCFEVKRFISRLKKDWDRLPPGMKKVWVFKDAFPVHAACGGFMAILEALKKNIPKVDYDQASSTLEEQFSLGYLDPDIQQFLENTVPPVQLHTVNFVRSGILLDKDRVFFGGYFPKQPWGLGVWTFVFGGLRGTS